MENTSYVLYIATSIIIAVMLIAVVIYVFNNLSTYQEDQDTLVERDNMTTFNEAFEVYQKNLMYGTDVLSCLNKAENNNQKYVYGLYYGTDTDITYNDIDEYLVQVNVTLLSTLEEEITATYKDNRNNIRPYFSICR